MVLSLFCHSFSHTYSIISTHVLGPLRGVHTAKRVMPRPSSTDSAPNFVHGGFGAYLNIITVFDSIVSN